MKTFTPTAQDLAFRKALERVIGEEGANLDVAVILALTCHLVGQLVALQDQRRYTPAQVMALVSANIQQGNREAITPLLNATGGTA